MIIKKSYKVKLYPTEAQEAELLKVLLACRWIWNHFLGKRQSDYLIDQKNVPYKVLSREMTKLRYTQPELSGVQAEPMHQALRRLETAYRRFYRKVSKLPSPKTEWGRTESFQKHQDWKIIGNKIQIQKNLLIKTRGTLPHANAKASTLVIKRIDNIWYACMFVQEKVGLPKRHTKPIGIDVGISSLATTNDGKKYEALKPSYALHHRMHKLQQKLARQAFGSKRREQTRLAIARLWHKIDNTRSNHLHQTTHAILAKNPSLIAIEDLNVIGMMKNHRLARTLADVSLGELHRQLQYKQIWRGGKVVVIDRFFPSTKTCSKCGNINETMTLATRNWTCAGCGAEHDRDINAAKVILKIGQGMASVETHKSRRNATSKEIPTHRTYNPLPTESKN